MPSPLGHALAGLAAGWALDPAPHGDRRRTAGRGAIFAVVATLPDLDLLVGIHRGPTHSLAASALAGVVAWACYGWGARRGGGAGASKARGPASAPLRLALPVAAAYATHVLLDWLGADSSAPIGLMALWPVSHEYYAASRPVFLAISRRYWLADFWGLNLRAVGRELLWLGPLALLAWRMRRRDVGAAARRGRSPRRRGSTRR